MSPLMIATVVLAFRQGALPKAQLDAVNSSMDFTRQGKYLEAAVVLEKLIKKSDPPGLLAQALSWDYAAMEEYDAAMESNDGSPDAKGITEPQKSLDELDKARAQDAIQAIVSEAKHRQIVILNEAHHVPRCRAFGLQLALALRKEGFEYFAAETFRPEVEAAFKKGVATRAMGQYTNEPMFGDLVRRTMALGYKPIRYEAEHYDAKGDSTDQINNREIQEASNIYDRVLKSNPNAKLLIYCGYEHASKLWRKTKDGRDYAWMAARLAKLTGIDPLTIDQTEELPHPNPGNDSPEYRYALSKGWLTRPVVFRSPDGTAAVFGTWKGRVDMQVFTPPVIEVDGRPDWTRIAGYRKPFVIPGGALPSTGRLLIQAFVMKEGDEIPMDQVLVSAGNKPPVLMLPKGRYKLIVQNEAGDSTPAGEIKQR